MGQPAHTQLFLTPTAKVVNVARAQVCVPIDPELAWEFDPDAVPTVASLLTQLNSSKGNAGAAAVGLRRLEMCCARPQRVRACMWCVHA